LKICLTINSSPWSAFKGGGQLAVHRLACALYAKGHQVHALYSKHPNEDFDVEVPYHIHWAKHHDFATVNLNIFSYLKVLGPLAKKEKFDVIHGNAEEAYSIGKIARKNGAAYVFTSHAPNIPVNGMLKGIINPIKFLKSINTYFLRQAIAEADQIVVFSQFSRQLILKGVGSNFADKVKVIPPGVENSWFKVERKPSATKKILFWGRLEDEKGLPEIIYAMQKISKVFKDMTLTLIGEGSRLEQYKASVANYGLKDRVEFTGWLSNREIQKLVTQSNLGLFPSRIESFGLSVVEAMAAGLPIVTASGGAIPENVKEGVTGMLVPINNADALTKAIISALENPQRAESLAKAAKMDVQKKFIWDKTADSLINLYQSTLQVYKSKA
jgi:glycosyltransferase involved in cell wall biosynthesis